MFPGFVSSIQLPTTALCEPGSQELSKQRGQKVNLSQQDPVHSWAGCVTLKLAAHISGPSVLHISSRGDDSPSWDSVRRDRDNAWEALAQCLAKREPPEQGRTGHLQWYHRVQSLSHGLCLLHREDAET